MNALRQKLISIYSADSPADARAKPEYQQLCDEHANDHVFDGERFMIEEVRKHIDLFLKAQNTYRDQAEQALRLIRVLESADKKEACIALVLATYGARWTPAQRQYFETRAPSMMEAIDYFLSFTTRNPGKPNLNYINGAHEHFIKDALGPNCYPKGHKAWIEQNLVAETIKYLLSNLGLKGFFFPDDAQDNAEVQKKLTTKCQAAFAFVQLIQTAIFTFEIPNWCLFEYEQVRANDSQRVLFVQIQDQIPNVGHHPNVFEWYQRVTKIKDPIKLAEVRSSPRSNRAARVAIDENRKAIQTKLLNQIQAAQNAIYLAIPG